MALLTVSPSPDSLHLSFSFFQVYCLSLCLSHDDFPGLLVHKIKCDVAYRKRVTCFAGRPAGWPHVVCKVFQIYRSACNRNSFNSLDFRHKCFTEIGIGQVSNMAVFLSFIRNLLSALSEWPNLVQMERVDILQVLLPSPFPYAWLVITLEIFLWNRHMLLDYLTLENGTDITSWNVDIQLPTYPI